MGLRLRQKSDLRQWGQQTMAAKTKDSPDRRPWETDWTPIKVRALIALWNEGLTTREIAKRLDVGRNAVVGKVHRLGLQRRPDPIPPSVQHQKPPRLGLADLGPHQCRWPSGNPGDEAFEFCGETVHLGKPYCHAHCARAYTRSNRDAFVPGPTAIFFGKEKDRSQ